jgi:hypothetical protein
MEAGQPPKFADSRRRKDKIWLASAPTAAPGWFFDLFGATYPPLIVFAVLHYVYRGPSGRLLELCLYLMEIL